MDKEILDYLKSSKYYKEFKDEGRGLYHVAPNKIVEIIKDYEASKNTVVLGAVSQQRELLLAYENYTSEMITGKTNDRTAKSLVNDFLANNCG